MVVFGIKNNFKSATVRSNNFTYSWCELPVPVLLSVKSIAHRCETSPTTPLQVVK